MTAKLCRIRDIPDGGAREFTMVGHEPQSVILIRRGQRIHAYENSCPHALARFDYAPDQFLFTPEGRLVCTQHGASFIVETGECVLGPCLGAYLQPFEIRVADGVVRVA